jgi:transposase InsO family protein
MEQICLEYPRYGYRRVTKQLQREGWIINHKKVARIMREKGWSCRPRKRKWVSTTDSNHNFRVYPNLIKDRTVDGINQVWVADITYSAPRLGISRGAYPWNARRNQMPALRCGRA